MMKQGKKWNAGRTGTKHNSQFAGSTGVTESMLSVMKPLKALKRCSEIGLGILLKGDEYPIRLFQHFKRIHGVTISSRFVILGGQLSAEISLFLRRMLTGVRWTI